MLAPMVPAVATGPKVADRSSVMVSLVEAPIWKVMAAARVPPCISFWPPKLVLVMTLASSLPSASYSLCIAVLSAAFDEASAAWVARSFMRVSMLPTSSSAPSAVCSREVEFWVLRIATLMPLVCDFRRVAICRPAASSIAELIRKPVLRRVIEVDSDDWVRPIEFLCGQGGSVGVKAQHDNSWVVWSV